MSETLYECPKCHTYHNAKEWNDYNRLGIEFRATIKLPEAIDRKENLICPTCNRRICCGDMCEVI